MSLMEGGNTVLVNVPANQMATAFVTPAMISSFSSMTDDYQPDMVTKILRAKSKPVAGTFNKDEFIRWLDTLASD